MGPVTGVVNCVDQRAVQSRQIQRNSELIVTGNTTKSGKEYRERKQQYWIDFSSKRIHVLNAPRVVEPRPGDCRLQSAQVITQHLQIPSVSLEGVHRSKLMQYNKGLPSCTQKQPRNQAGVNQLANTLVDEPRTLLAELPPAAVAPNGKTPAQTLASAAASLCPGTPTFPHVHAGVAPTLSHHSQTRGTGRARVRRHKRATDSIEFFIRNSI